MTQFSRRQMLSALGLGALGASASGWLPAFAQELGKDPRRKRKCVLLWMTGGPAQTDTFDMKPGHANGGEFKEIQTSVPGLKFSEHLPKLAAMADKLAIVRSVSTKEGDHGRGTYLMRTGHQPMGPIRYPTIGSSLSKELGDPQLDVPSYVSIGPYRVFNQAAFSPGFLGPQFAPLTVGASDVFRPQQARAGQAYASLKVDDLRPPEGVTTKQVENRVDLWETLQGGFLKNHKVAAPVAHDTTYRRALRMMNSSASKAFDLTEESNQIRDAYGRGRFGQGCLMARRLIEQGVSFVEVTLGGAGGLGWDTHQNNFRTVKQLSQELDAGWATLMKELDERGLLEDTTIVWMGEFGRTPRINRNGGRDHFPAAWTSVLAGGGIKGGQAYGKTTKDGTKVDENKVDVGDLLATLSQAVGVPAERQNISEMGRPIRIAEGKPIKDILA